MNPITTDELIRLYKQVRTTSEQICHPLQTEDYVVQPVEEVSPPKWHLGHTTWFFETFLLKTYAKGYTVFDPQYNYVFNSYYESIGARVIRTDRGNLSRPTVKDVYRYRQYVDAAMIEWLHKSKVTGETAALIILGINHEEQHQELLYTDIKYILGHNPLFPAYRVDYPVIQEQPVKGPAMIKVKEAIYEVGYKADGFCWDNERGIHKQYLADFTISSQLVTATGSCKSYLVSLHDQVVYIKGTKVHFKKGEPIFMEVSQKYTLSEIDTMAQQSGFAATAHLQDSKGWFVDALWEAV